MSNYSGHVFSPDVKNDSWGHIYAYIPGKARVLDVGCSDGEFGEALIRLKGCEVVGIDPDKTDLAKAKKKLTAAYQTSVEDADPKLLGKFDVVIFADVIEHILEPVSSLQTIRKHFLKPNGIVCFSIPNMAHISVRLGLLEGRFPHKDKGLLDKTHLHFYDVEEVARVFADAGYNIVQLNPVTIGYPEKMIESRLRTVGLIATKDFFENNKKNRSDIFQIVGYAKAATKEVKKSPAPYVMPHDEIRHYAEDLAAEGQQLRHELEVLKAENNSVSQKLAALKERPVRFILKHAIKSIRGRKE